MEIPKKLAYGLRVVIRLARSPQGAGMAEMAHEQHTAAGYLSKVVVPLIRDGIITPTGTNHIALAKPSSQITLADIITAYGPAMQLTRCLLRHGDIHPCSLQAECGLHKLWEHVQADLHSTLARYTLKEFAHCADIADAARGEADGE